MYFFYALVRPHYATFRLFVLTSCVSVCISIPRAFQGNLKFGYREIIHSDEEFCSTNHNSFALIYKLPFKKSRLTKMYVHQHIKKIIVGAYRVASQRFRPRHPLLETRTTVPWQKQPSMKLATCLNTNIKSKLACRCGEIFSTVCPTVCSSFLNRKMSCVGLVTALVRSNVSVYFAWLCLCVTLLRDSYLLHSR